jgi:hypothetical protein
MSSLISKFTKSLDRPLFSTALIHLLFAGFCLLASLFDDRVLLGLPVWIKPFKFAISFGLYAFSLAYLVPFVQNRLSRRIISYVTLISVSVVVLLVGIQAARGEISHFNDDDGLGDMIYSIMSVFAVTTTLSLIYLIVELLRKPQAALTSSFRLAVQLGLWFTLIGSLVGAFMAELSGHTVGGPDGGPGLPVLSWSTVLGDWRVAHFLGLHGLQVFILAGWFSKKWRQAKLFLWGLALAYGGLIAYVCWLTLNSKSLFSI